MSESRSAFVGWHGGTKENMQIVVTGSRSFIGRRFIAMARDAGVCVIGVDSLAGGPEDVFMDIRDNAFAASIPQGADAVVHLAAISRDGDCRDDACAAFDVNVTGTLNVLRACRERGVRQLIFASTEWVYGNASTNVQREDDPIDVTQVSGEYALTKITAECALALACPRELENITILRFGIVYGPRPANWSAVESLFEKVATVNSIVVGSLATARRFVHVDDIARGILAALGRTGHEIFNLSGDKLVTLGEIIETSSRIHQKAPSISETQPATASVRNPDNAKAAALLGWRPTIGLEAGLRSLCGAALLSGAK
jgi:UDP-glucose 4-epimerase